MRKQRWLSRGQGHDWRLQDRRAKVKLSVSNDIHGIRKAIPTVCASNSSTLTADGVDTILVRYVSTALNTSIANYFFCSCVNEGLFDNKPNGDTSAAVMNDSVLIWLAWCWPRSDHCHLNPASRHLPKKPPYKKYKIWNTLSLFELKTLS